MYQNPFLNPYGAYPQQYTQMAQTQPPQQVVKVNGEIGANSSAILLDESGTMVWLCTTDGAGYKTVTAYDITPHQNTPAPDYGILENRIKRLEEIVNGNARNTSADSNVKPYDAKHPQNDEHGQYRTESAVNDESVGYKQPSNERSNGNNQQVWGRS